jgi:hypothetical protein
MSWVLIYISTKFLDPIPLISVGIDDFLSEFLPTSTNSSNRFSQKSASRKKPAHRPAKAGHRLKPAHRAAKAGPQSRRLLRLAPLFRSSSLRSSLSSRQPRITAARHLLLGLTASPAARRSSPRLSRSARPSTAKPPCHHAQSTPSQHRYASTATTRRVRPASSLPLHVVSPWRSCSAKPAPRLLRVHQLARPALYRPAQRSAPPLRCSPISHAGHSPSPTRRHPHRAACLAAPSPGPATPPRAAPTAPALPHLCRQAPAPAAHRSCTHLRPARLPLWPRPVRTQLASTHDQPRPRPPATLQLAKPPAVLLGPTSSPAPAQLTTPQTASFHPVLLQLKTQQ